MQSSIALESGAEPTQHRSAPCVPRCSCRVEKSEAGAGLNSTGVWSRADPAQVWTMCVLRLLHVAADASHLCRDFSWLPGGAHECPWSPFLTTEKVFSPFSSMIGNSFYTLHDMVSEVFTSLHRKQKFSPLYSYASSLF